MKPSLVIGPEDNPYMLRWHILKWKHFPRVYIHKILRSDDDRALHDHPWWFISFMFRGSYTEITPQGAVRRDSPSVAFRPLSTRHRVELNRVFPEPTDPEHWSHKAWERTYKPVWTLVITGPEVRRWGFWCPDIDQGKHIGDHWIPSRQFQGCGE